MKFSINKDKAEMIISEYMGILKEVKSENVERAILEGLYISVKDNRAIFRGTNKEIELVRYADCDVETEGSVLIKPQLLLEYIKLLETDKIYFEKRRGYLIINDAEFSIFDETIYPELIEISTFVVAKENAKKFATLLEKVKFLVASNNADVLFNSIKIKFLKDFCELISTDSFRLVYLKENMNVNIEREILLPIETANIIYKLFKDLDKEISISVDEDKLIILWEDAYFTSKLISLKYVDYNSLLNGFKYDKTMEFNSSELKASLKKVISVIKNNSIDSKNIASFNFVGNKLNISAYSSNAKINERVNVIKSGEDLKIGLNCKYLKDFVDNLEKNVLIFAKDSFSMLKLCEEKNENYIYLVMPLNIR